MDIFNLTFANEHGDECCVCPNCRSDHATPTEDGGVRCLDCLHENGKPMKQVRNPPVCPACGWHMMSHINLTSGSVLQCNRCHTRFSGGKAHPATLCPTCGVYAAWRSGRNSFECLECGITHPTDSTYARNLLPPKRCTACGRNAAHPVKWTVREKARPVWRTYENGGAGVMWTTAEAGKFRRSTRADVLQCKLCGQISDPETGQMLDFQLRPTQAMEATETLDQDISFTFSNGIDNTLQTKE